MTATAAHDRTSAERRVRTDQLLARMVDAPTEQRDLLRAEVVTLNIDLAESAAARYRNRGVDHDDLVQVACLGLVKAVDGFDPDAGYAFTAYAMPTIRGEVMRYFRDHGWMVRPPRPIQELQPRIRAAREELTQVLGRSPRPTDIATHLALPVEDVIEAMSADGCFTPTSLDTTVSDDDSAPMDHLGATDSGLPGAEARMLLAPLLRDLGPRDKEILYLRFFEGLRQREIGERIGLSQMQVSRILTRILTGLRTQIGTDDVTDLPEPVAS